jgi:hypothetical protein
MVYISEPVRNSLPACSSEAAWCRKAGPPPGRAGGLYNGGLFLRPSINGQYRAGTGARGFFLDSFENRVDDRGRLIGKGVALQERHALWSCVNGNK